MGLKCHSDQFELCHTAPSRRIIHQVVRCEFRHNPHQQRQVFRQRNRLQQAAGGSCRAQPPEQKHKPPKLAKELEEGRWSTATVVENKAVSLDGNLRTLVLSVEDKVVYLEGRSMHRKQERPRWADTFKVPGQFVAVRLSPNEEAEQSATPDTGTHLLAITSSPYAVRRDSADLDASLIEVLVDRSSQAHEQNLASLGPGHLLEVSNVLGRGFCSLFNSYVGLLSALEESRDICLIGTGCRGIASLRSVLEWTPVQAHATAHAVQLIYACPSPSSAAFVKDWDSWREAGITVTPVYTVNDTSQRSSEGNGASADALQARLLSALSQGDQGLSGSVSRKPGEMAVLMSGMPGSTAAAISRELTSRGFERERILFCDYM